MRKVSSNANPPPSKKAGKNHVCVSKLRKLVLNYGSFPSQLVLNFS
jgi:hypothetical protein